MRLPPLTASTARPAASDGDVTELYWQQWCEAWRATGPGAEAVPGAGAAAFVWVAADPASTLQECWAPSEGGGATGADAGRRADSGEVVRTGASLLAAQAWFDAVAAALVARGSFDPRYAAAAGQATAARQASAAGQASAARQATAAGQATAADAGSAATKLDIAQPDATACTPHKARIAVTSLPMAARVQTASFVPHADLDAAATLAGGRRESWVLGRAAMHGALRAHGVACAAIGRTDTGAPALPRNVVGSLSHKPKVAWAGCVRLPTIPIAAEANDARAAAPVPPAAAPVPPTVAPRSAAFTLGVDVELIRAVTPRFATRILCEVEQGWLATLPPHAHDLAIIVHFAAKEAVYKALHPWLPRYVGFREVGLQWRDAAMAEVTLPADAAGLRCSVQWRLGWTSSAAYVLAWACVYGECRECDGVAPDGSVAGSNTTHDCGPRCQR